MPSSCSSYYRGGLVAFVETYAGIVPAQTPAQQDTSPRCERGSGHLNACDNCVIPEHIYIVHCRNSFCDMHMYVAYKDGVAFIPWKHKLTPVVNPGQWVLVGTVMYTAYYIHVHLHCVS